MESYPAVPAVPVADQRRSERRALEVPVRLCVTSGTVGGMTDNVSSVGLMFFSDEPLRVEVELEEGGLLQRFSGRLVRVQRMSETTTGYAVELDPR